MAPELAFDHNYSKSVDMWASGLILYQLLNKGRHPLYIKGEGSESYKKKLRSPEWTFNPDNMSQLAKNLFLRLVKLKSKHRYTAH